MSPMQGNVTLAGLQVARDFPWLWTGFGEELRVDLRGLGLYLRENTRRYSSFVERIQTCFVIIKPSLK